METSVQQSPSAFRELRQAAGYKTVTALAQELGLPRRTVASWDTGRYVPKWPNVQKIAKAFRVEQVQCFNKLRNESIEDALSCGCQGRKVSPKHDGARCLSVEIPCKNCRKVRTYEQGHSTHRELCKRCAAKLRHPTDFTPYRCVGDHYGKSAPNCLGTRKSGHRKGELRLRNYKNKENLTPEQRSSGKIPWIDESAHEYLCPHCSTAAQKRAEIDEAIIAVVTSKQTQATEEPRVKDPAVRRSLLTKYWNMNFHLC